MTRLVFWRNNPAVMRRRGWKNTTWGHRILVHRLLKIKKKKKKNVGTQAKKNDGRGNKAPASGTSEPWSELEVGGGSGIVEWNRRGSPTWPSEKHVKGPTKTTLGLSFLVCETEIMLVLSSRALVPEPSEPDCTSGIHDVFAVIISIPRG